VSDAEWHALVSSHSNLLLEGTPAAADRVLRALHPHLDQPLISRRAASPVSLPRDHRGSLVLHDVTTLDGRQQDRVFDWLTETQGRVQVVSTALRPLFPLVERGEFRADLYYRLAVVRIVAE
jgi:hypothetical protein